jgi:hypothetical protein
VSHLSYALLGLEQPFSGIDFKMQVITETLIAYDLKNSYSWAYVIN